MSHQGVYLDYIRDMLENAEKATRFIENKSDGAIEK